MMDIKKIKLLALSMLLALSVCIFSGCGGEKGQQDIVVLYTNDVHCAVDENIGYAGWLLMKSRWKRRLRM